MMTINPYEFDQQKLHRLMLGSIAPRPIAFASTVDKDGNPNLSPFSFFQCFWRKSYYPDILTLSART